MNFLRRASGPGKTLSFCLGESFYFSSGATLFWENLSYLPLDLTGFHGDILILIGCFVFDNYSLSSLGSSLGSFIPPTTLGSSSAGMQVLFAVRSFVGTGERVM